MSTKNDKEHKRINSIDLREKSSKINIGSNCTYTFPVQLARRIPENPIGLMETDPPVAALISLMLSFVMGRILGVLRLYV